MFLGAVRTGARFGSLRQPLCRLKPGEEGELSGAHQWPLLQGPIVLGSILIVWAFVSHFCSRAY